MKRLTLQEIERYRKEAIDWTTCDCAHCRFLQEIEALNQELAIARVQHNSNGDLALEEAARILDFKAREHDRELTGQQRGTPSFERVSARMKQCRYDAEDIRALKSRLQTDYFPGLSR